MVVSSTPEAAQDPLSMHRQRRCIADTDVVMLGPPRIRRPAIPTTALQREVENMQIDWDSSAPSKSDGADLMDTLLDPDVKEVRPSPYPSVATCVITGMTPPASPPRRPHPAFHSPRCGHGRARH